MIFIFLRVSVFLISSFISWTYAVLLFTYFPFKKKRQERFLSKVDFSNPISCSFKNVMHAEIWLMEMDPEHLMFKFQNQNHYFMIKTDSLKRMQAAFYACFCLSSLDSHVVSRRSSTPKLSYSSFHHTLFRSIDYINFCVAQISFIQQNLTGREYMIQVHANYLMPL